MVDLNDVLDDSTRDLFLPTVEPFARLLHKAAPPVVTFNFCI
jgi:hypothetical protein